MNQEKKKLFNEKVSSITLLIFYYSRFHFLLLIIWSAPS